MATELCQEKWAWTASGTTSITSPRLSFSLDLSTSDITPAKAEQRSDGSPFLGFPSPSSYFDLDSCSADELFSNGKLLPLPIKTKNSIHSTTLRDQVPIFPPPPPPPSSLPPAAESLGGEPKKGSFKEITTRRNGAGGPEEKPHVAAKSSFWLFPRSSSLNCGSGSKASLIFSLPLLSRSKSTGSYPIAIQKHRQSGHLTTSTTAGNKSSFRKTAASNSNSKSAGSYYYAGAKNGSYHYGNGVRISPVLNVPPPYIPRGSGSPGFFGLGHLLCNGKEKISRKKPLFSHSI